MKSKNSIVTALILLLMSPIIMGHGLPPDNLIGIKPPKTPGLSGGSKPIIVSAHYARMLGKALFWDSSIGSDGMACATCHYHAGADERTTNQMNPGQRHVNSLTGETFQPMASGGLGGVNYTLRLQDFPTYQLSDPSDRLSSIVFRSDDVVGSSGTNLGVFESASATGTSSDNCANLSDPIFHLDGKNTRRTTDRNAPSVINAVFNFRNFWDGRANNLFNGETSWGNRDPQAGAWVTGAGGVAYKRNLALQNASLASQAVAPPINDSEMSCKQRSMADVGFKMLKRRALESQTVSPEDSVLGRFASKGGKGITLTYEQMIRKAFSKRFWNGKGDFGVQKNGTPYTMMEANFALFFGIAVMEYEKTLISNKSPYDTPMGPGHIPKGLNDQQKRGLQLFLNGHCQNCHGGPTFSAAADPYLLKVQEGYPNLVTRSSVDGSVGPMAHNVLRDIGFANTSVTPTSWDIGAGDVDPWGNPLTYSAQYSEALSKGSNSLVDPIRIFACSFEVPFVFDWALDALQEPNVKYPPEKCKGYREQGLVPKSLAWSAEQALPKNGKAGIATAGTFKIPSLRNVELTGPFMHNGSMKNLEEVIDFYNRGGNLINENHFETFVFPQGFSPQEKADLVAFLKSLTDERVRWEQAPFDHPELVIPNGAIPGAVSPIRSNVTADLTETIPAIGRGGRSIAEGPLHPFEDALAR